MEDKTKIVVCGAEGKMGSLIIQLAIQKKEEFIVKGGVEYKAHSSVGKTNSSGIFISDNLSDVMKGDEVVIDFSTPEGAIEHLKECKIKKTPFVTGVTGFNSEDMKILKESSSDIPVFYSPNMSIGVNLFFEIIKFSAKILKEYEIEISEIHHKFKKDAPSGTAKKIADIICNILNRKPEKVIKHGRAGLTGIRAVEEIGIHSLRLGDIVGEHYVYFGGSGEVIEISHRCYNRTAFASGALKAASFIKNKKTGFYTMEDILREVMNV
ncbi:MAG: 4-hydroxy-tetrahydrodipicolinate reductase [bacterium]|nr:4-hydroxy-tetrahydrodipicolinate reductase [bacterium]